MAEQKAQAKEPTAEKPVVVAPAQKPTLFIILAVVNMLIVGAVGAMLFLNNKKEQAKPKIEDVVAGEHDEHQQDEQKDEEFIGKTVPMETFLVNLAGSRGGKLAKINMELELDNLSVQEEIEKRKPQIRDIIIILLSSKTYEQLSSRDGKDALRDEVKDMVNSFLTKGKIKRVYFTDIVLN